MAKEEVKKTEKVNLVDLLAQEEPIELEKKFLTATTISDGYTGTYQGDHLFLVEKEGADYTVSPVAWDEEKAEFKVADAPIITTDDKTVFFVVSTTDKPYEHAGIKSVTIGEKEVLEKQVIQAFLAFIHDEYQLGIYNAFISGEPVLAGEAKETAPEPPTETEGKEGKELAKEE